MGKLLLADLIALYCFFQKSLRAAPTVP